MHTDAEAFLQRVRAFPEDDAQRLIFADWLDEEGDPRGRFVRVQLALAHVPEHDRARPALLAEERQLLEAHRDAWLAPFRGLVSGPVFRRGFVEEVKVEARTFLRHADEIFAAAPVRHVHLLDVGSHLAQVFQSPFLSRLSALTVYAQHAGEPLARAAARCPHLAGLKVLHLRRNRFGDDAAEHLAGSPHLANLEELDLSENEIGETGGRALAASPHLGALRVLELAANRLGPGGAEALAGSERMTALRRLGLSDNDIGGSRLLALGRAHELLTVPVLDLSLNGLNFMALQAILTRPAGAERPVRLAELHLGSNPLDDAGAAVLAHCPHLGGLTALALPNTNVGDEGVRLLARSEHLNRVRELDLCNNPVGDTGFRALHGSEHWRSLTRLLYSPLGVSHDMRRALDQKFNRPPRRA